jgi:hypothetical protein
MNAKPFSLFLLGVMVVVPLTATAFVSLLSAAHPANPSSAGALSVVTLLWATAGLVGVIVMMSLGVVFSHRRAQLAPIPFVLATHPSEAASNITMDEQAA